MKRDVGGTAWAQAPASSANLGSGFDCLAIALQGLGVQVWLAPNAQAGPPLNWTTPGEEVHWQIAVSGQEIEGIPLTGDNLVARAVRAAFAQAGAFHPPGWQIKIQTNIPPGRGMGSSAAATSAALQAANLWLECMGRKLSPKTILQVAGGIEGHADNVAAALQGGVALVWDEGPAEQEPVWQTVTFRPAQPLAAVIAAPHHSLSTSEGRKVLPQAVRRQDAVFNSARTALLSFALLRGQFQLLAEAMADRLHQPHRAQLMPWLPAVLKAAQASGAYGASLSGAGPSVLALCSPNRRVAVADALQNTMAEQGVPARVLTADLARQGTTSRLLAKSFNDCVHEADHQGQYDAGARALWSQQ